MSLLGAGLAFGQTPQDSGALELPEAKAVARRTETAAVKADGDFIRKQPGAMGDPVRALGAAPGVSVQNDVNVRPMVRGGDADQTRVVMDGIPLLQPYHVGGSFSLFNLAALDAAELHRDDFPVEDPGALSGVLDLRARTRAPSAARGTADVSMIRGGAFSEIPLPQGLDVYGAAQSFLFNRSLRGLLDLSSMLSGDSAFRDEMSGYRERVNMPDFQDYHFGAALRRGDARVGYAGSRSTDGYEVVVPRQTNILSRMNPHLGDPTAPVIPPNGPQENPREKKLSVDHVSGVDVDNGMHFLTLDWDAGPDHFLQSALGFQAQDWSVDFKQGMEETKGLSLSQSTRYFNYRFCDTYSPAPEHRFKAGWSWDYKRQSFAMNLPYALYDVIVNGNMDMLEPLGLFSPRGLTIAKEDSTRGDFDYLGEFPSRIHFAHAGTLEEHFAAVFFSHEWTLPAGSLSYGLRAEYHSLSHELAPAPRAEWRWDIDARDQLRFTAGMYAQDDLPFYERDGNRALKAEKSAQAGVAWTRRLGRGTKLVVEGYYKRYWDLAAPRLVPDNTFDPKAFLLPLPAAHLPPEEVARLKARLDTASDLAAWPDSLRREVYDAFGGLAFAYSSTGTGNSAGTELACYYNPAEKWKGWIALDAGVSTRRDTEDGPSYPFAYDRPLAVSWVNDFAIPGGFELGLTWRWALGRPYTPYSGGVDSISVGARNSGRLSPYNRLDLRLSRNMRWGARALSAYVEVWNATNSPNYFARDAETGELKAAQLNWPFPVFFLGMSLDL